jgi:hypothetical protein
MTPVVTPHEVLMALRSDLFPWQSKVITDFTLLLDKLASAPAIDAKEEANEA